VDQLAGKVCVVAGAGARGEGLGNGRAAAVSFAREGALVMAVDRDGESAERTMAMFFDVGGTAEAS
jgi:NAD(P)-dependent dehydrogenase (short-subunit alcohol dehydrogenase family)